MQAVKPRKTRFLKEEEEEEEMERWMTRSETMALRLTASEGEIKESLEAMERRCTIAAKAILLSSEAVSMAWMDGWEREGGFLRPPPTDHGFLV